MVVTTEIDEEMRRYARANADFCLKESQKEMVRTPTMIGGQKDPFYVGFLGEMVARRYFGLPLLVKEYLDYGYDFKLGERRVDVKTSMLHKPLEFPVKEGFRVFVGTNEKLLGSDTLLFVKLESDIKAHLLGWIERSELERFPVVKYGEMPVPAYAVYFKYLKPISLLEGKHG